MDQIVFLAWRATKAIEKSIDSLNDKTLFQIDSNEHDDELMFEKAQFLVEVMMQGMQILEKYMLIGEKCKSVFEVIHWYYLNT